MIKKLSLLLSMTVMTLAIALGMANPVFAQATNPAVTNPVYQNEDDAWFLSVADALQMTVPDLKTALSSGQTVEQLAQLKNVSLDTVVTAVTAARAAQLQIAVQAGKLTQDQANQLLAGLKTGYTFWFSTGRPPEAWKERDLAEDSLALLASQLSMTPHDLHEALRSGETIAQLAQEKGISVDNLVTNLTTKRIAQIQQEVTDGKLTQDQANLILANLQKGYTAWFTNGKPPDGWSDRTVADEHLEVLANQLGITPGQLKDDLKSSDTLEQLAQEKGVSVNTLVTEITANRAAELQKEVAAGKLTQAQATQILTNLQDEYNQWFSTGNPPAGWKDRALTEDHVDVAAKTLGLTPDQLRDDLKSGQTLDQIAQEKGLSLDTLTNAETQGAANALVKQVAAGKLTQAQADAKLALLRQQELNKLKNSNHPFIVHPNPKN